MAEIHYYVRIIDKKGSERTVLISEKDLESPTKAFNIFSANGIVFSKYLGHRDSLELLQNYLYSNIIGETLEYHYKPGWYNGIFKFCNGNKIADTPFFNKKLLFNDKIPQAQSSSYVLNQIKTVSGNAINIGLFFLIILHYSILISQIPRKYRLKKPVVIYGKSYDTELVTKQLFNIYNCDKYDCIDLSDKKVIDCLDELKDEIALIRDSACTDYKKKAALNKYQDVLQYMKGEECECLCVILFDCGVVQADESNFHIVADKLSFVDSKKYLLPTHIKYFTDWMTNKTFRSPLPSGKADIEISNAVCVFYTVFMVTAKYYHECANINLLKEFGFNDNGEVLKRLKEYISNATKYIGGYWMCEIFKKTYRDLRNTGRLKFYSNSADYRESDNLIITVMNEKHDILIPSSDFDRLLCEFPMSVRRIDVLRELRKAGVLTVDDPSRFTKNKYVDGHIVDVVSVNKEFLKAETGEL